MGQAIKPSTPKGTRDFSPAIMRRRNYLFGTVKEVFEKFGFESIETPALEKLTTLTGKYGEEGDRLIFKVLNSGDFLAKADEYALHDKNSQKVVHSISEKALRYDLTVPFARYVVQHQNDISFPFRRYQVQPVWRADRPQKGRYCEFYQCDADVIGTTSLLIEAELLQMMLEVFEKLQLPVTIKLNNRKILKGIAESIGHADRFSQIVIIIDKLDKIGPEKVIEELEALNLGTQALESLDGLFGFNGGTDQKIEFLDKFLANSDSGKRGIAEIRKVIDLAGKLGIDKSSIEFDFLLARGLDYYTGAIFEVVAGGGVKIGSICGGGRYDNLTGIFGLNDMSGVGISFGIDRIYDAMDELELFADKAYESAQVLFVNFGDKELDYLLPLAVKLREMNHFIEIYPDAAKMKKQLKYADSKNIRFVVLAGEEEVEKQLFTLKDMNSGEQHQYNFKEIIKTLDSYVNYE